MDSNLEQAKEILSKIIDSYKKGFRLCQQIEEADKLLNKLNKTTFLVANYDGRTYKYETLSDVKDSLLNTIKCIKYIKEFSSNDQFLNSYKINCSLVLEKE